MWKNLQNKIKLERKKLKRSVNKEEDNKQRLLDRQTNKIFDEAWTMKNCKEEESMRSTTHI